MSNRKIINAAATGDIGYYPVGNPTDAYYDNVSLLLNGDIEVDSNFANVSLLLDGNTLTDKSNNKATITTNGNAVVSNTTKKFGTGSLYFDGNGDSVSAPYNSGYYLNSADTFTIEMWINPTALVAGTTPRLLNIGTYASSDYLIIDFIVNSNLLRFGMETTSSSGISNWVISYTGIPPLNTWTHIAFVCSGLGANQTKLYINGTLAASGTSASSMGTNGALWVGGITWASATTYCYSGYIDDFRITKGIARYTANFTPPVKAFPTHEILDSSVYRLPVTAYGNARIDTATKKFGTGAMYFDGTGDYLTLPSTANNSINGTENFTIEAWLYPTDASTYHCFYSGQWAVQVYMNVSRKIELAFGTSASSGSYITTQQSTGTLTLNQWTHVAVTRIGNNFTIFLNGVLDSTYASAGGSIGVQTSTSVGCFNSTNYFFTGFIDDLRITKGVARYTTNFTPPSASLPTIPPTISADPWWGNVSLLLDGNTTDAYDPYWQNVSLMLTGDDFIDWSNQHSAVTVVGNTAINTTTKKFGTGSMYFDGSGDYLNLTYDKTKFDWWTSDFTLECWVNPTTLASFDFYSATYNVHVSNLIGNASASSAYANWLFGPIGDGRIAFYYYNGTVVTPTLSTATISAGAWSHIALTKTSAGFQIWVNGVGNGYATISGTPQAGTDAAFIIGNCQGTSINGYVDDLRITKGLARYTTNFTPPTAALPSYKIQDRTQNNLTLTPYGNVQLSTDVMKNGTGSMFFDGSGDYLSIPNNVGFRLLGDSFTVEFWVYFNVGWTNRGLVGIHDNSSDGWFLRTTGTALRVYNNGAGSNDITTSFNTGQWYHIAWSSTGTSSQLFINGVSIATIPTSGVNNTGNNLQIGQTTTVGDYLNGYIDDLRITKGYARYTQNFTPPSQSFATQYISTGYDANYADVSLLLNGNGTNGSTTFTDLSSTPKTITAYGNAQISTAVKKYGTGAMYFDGSGDYLATPSTPNLSFGSGDFTIEVWVYANSLGSFNAVFAQWPDDGASSNNSYVLESVGSSMYFYCAASGSVIFATLGTITTGSWIHYAICRSGNTLYPFKNGVLGTTVSITQTLNSPTSAVTVGGNVAVSGFWNGYIDDLRITKGIARYTTNFTPPTYQLPTDTTGTVIDPLRSSTSLLLRGNGTNGSTSFVDESPNGLTVTNNGSVTVNTTTKKYGTGAMYFGGSGNYLTLAANSAFNFGTGDFTIECWVRPTTAQTADMFWVSSSGSGGLFFGTHSGGIGWGRANVAWDYTSGVYLTLNSWSHVTLVRSGTLMGIYVNGTIVGALQSNSTSYDVSTTTLNIGSQANSYYFTGYLDDVRITKGYARYTANFTPPTYEDPIVTGTVYDYNYPQVSLLLNGDGTNGSTVFEDLSGSPKTVTNTGSVAINTSVKKFGTGAIYVPSSTSYLTVANTGSSLDLGTGDFTIEFWLYVTAFVDYVQHVSTRTSNSTTMWGIDSRANGTIYLHSSDFVVTSSAGKTANTWNHVCVVRQSGVCKMYINGVLEGTSTNSSLSSANFAAPSGVGVGAGAAGMQGGTAYIDDLRITKGLARYTQNFTPPTAPLPTSYS